MISINNRVIGDGNPCYITYEVGPTHNGFESAKDLMKLAAEAGADAVKFQIFDPDKLVSDKKQLFSYSVLKDRKTGELETIEEPLYDILKRRSLSNSEWRKLKEYADELGIAFFSTVGFDEDIDFLAEIGCHSIKIASADVNHFPLLRKAARTGMCIQLDTGMATLSEIEAAINVINSEGNQNIIIHQCPSGYPARLESINLNIIKTMKQIFPYPIAFSDHTPGDKMDIAALALGANLLEKTITHDRMTRSIEHVFSLEPSEMKEFVNTVREVEVGLGKYTRVLHPEEVKKRNAIRRSVYLAQPAAAGTKLKDVHVEFRRPGFGITPDRYEDLTDLQLKTDLAAGHCLELKDLI